MANVLNPGISLRTGQYNDGSNIDGIFCLATPSVTYHDATISSSTDPLATKTNKYAESKIIAVTAKTKGVHIKFGTSAVADATTSDFLIIADTTVYFQIDPDYAYIRVIQSDATAEVFVTEIY